MEDVLFKLKKEKMELLGKIKNLDKFRGTSEWEKLSVAHKQLLDIQLQSMRTYYECLVGRVLDIESTPKEEEIEEPTIKIIKIVLDNEKD